MSDPKLVHILDVLDAIADWKAPFEVAEELNIPVKAAEAMLRSVVRLGRAEYGAPNNTYRAIPRVRAPVSSKPKVDVREFVASLATLPGETR